MITDNHLEVGVQSLNHGLVKTHKVYSGVKLEVLLGLLFIIYILRFVIIYILRLTNNRLRYPLLRLRVSSTH